MSNEKQQQISLIATNVAGQTIAMAMGEVNDAVLEDTALEMLMEALDMTSADLPVDDIYVDERHEGTYKTTYASWRYED